MNNNTHWHKMIIILCTLIAFWLAIELNHFLQSNDEANQQVDIENWTNMEIILLRKCRTAWPLMVDEYETCIGKVKAMYRKDI